MAASEYRRGRRRPSKSCGQATQRAALVGGLVHTTSASTGSSQRPQSVPSTPKATSHLPVVSATRRRDSRPVRRWIVAGCLAWAGAAGADTTYTFHWDHGEKAFLEFASHDALAQGRPEDSWDADVDSSGNITVFETTNSFPHPTPYAIGTETLEAILVIDHVSGSVDFAHHTAVFTVQAEVRFAATGVVAQGTCRTSTFTISFNGQYLAGADSAPFAVPALSGTGAQACGTSAAFINNKLALGTAGAKLHFNKFQIRPL